jgi:8-oxo-dGTP diphosphatase
MRNIVNALLVRNRTILMVRRSSHRRAYPNRWSFPGGHVEVGETVADALKRELTEEIGISPIDYRLINSIRDPNATHEDVIYHMHVVTAWAGGEPRLMDREHIELRWLSKQEALGITDLALEEYRTLIEGLFGTP